MPLPVTSLMQVLCCDVMTWKKASINSIYVLLPIVDLLWVTRKLWYPNSVMTQMTNSAETMKTKTTWSPLIPDFLLPISWQQPHMHSYCPPRWLQPWAISSQLQAIVPDLTMHMMGITIHNVNTMPITVSLIILNNSWNHSNCKSKSQLFTSYIHLLSKYGIIPTK